MAEINGQQFDAPAWRLAVVLLVYRLTGERWLDPMVNWCLRRDKSHG